MLDKMNKDFKAGNNYLRSILLVLLLGPLNVSFTAMTPDAQSKQ